MEKCHFCLENKSLQGDIWLKGELFYVVSALNEFPEHAGMIVPLRHIETPFEFTVAEWADLQEILTQTKLLLDKYAPIGYNLGWNVGKVAGQHVMHAHLHVMPRFDNDPFAGQGIRAGFKVSDGK